MKIPLIAIVATTLLAGSAGFLYREPPSARAGLMRLSWRVDMTPP